MYPMKIFNFQGRNASVEIILILAFVLRVLWAIAVPVIPLADSLAYDTFALNLANCHNYGWNCTEPSAYWPVGTSFIYSLFYKVFGHHFFPIIIFNLVLAVLAIGLTMHLAQTWFGPRVAIVTGVLLAVWPSQIEFTTVLASEQIFIVLTILALALWIPENVNLWFRAILVGIAIAAATYVKPIAALIPVLLLFLRYINTREIRRSLMATCIMLMVIALLIAPWSIRNTQAFGQFVTISTNGGANLWMGNNPASKGDYMELPPEVTGMNEAKRDQYLKLQAIAHIKEKPLLFAWRTIRRTVDTYSRESIGIVWNEAGLVSRYGTWILLPLKLINQLYWTAVLGLSLLGVALLGKQKGWRTMITHPTVLLWAYFAAIHAFIVAQDRYHFPSIPMIAILAAFAFCTVKPLGASTRQG